MSATGYRDHHGNGGARLSGGCYDLSDPHSFRHQRTASASGASTAATTTTTATTAAPPPPQYAGFTPMANGGARQDHPGYQHSLGMSSSAHQHHQQQHQHQLSASSSSLDTHRPPITLSTSFRASQTMMSPSRHHSGTSSGDDQFDATEDAGVNGRFLPERRTSGDGETAPLLGSRVRPEQAQRSFSQPAATVAAASATLGSSWNGGHRRQQQRQRGSGHRSKQNSRPTSPGNTLTVNSGEGSYGSLAEIEPLVVPGPGLRAMRSDSSFSAMVRPRRQKCQTCGGSGHLRKDNANELVALVPYGDQRLKPNRTKCYVSLAILFTVLGIGVAVFFLYPRRVTTSTCARTRNVHETSFSTMNVDLELHFNVTNHNFFNIQLDNMSVSMRQVDLSLGTTIIRFVKRNILTTQHTMMLRHKVNGTFFGQQGRHAVEQCRQNASQNFFLTLRIELTSVYLGISTQTDIIVPHFFSCLPNTTYTAAAHQHDTLTTTAAATAAVTSPVVRFVPAQQRSSPWLWSSLLPAGRETYRNSCDELRPLVPVNQTLHRRNNALL